MDRIEAMAILLKVAELGSFSAAGRALGMPLATVSRKVSELEAHLGTRLLARTTRKVTLTDAGAAYMETARRVLDDIDEMERAAAGEFHAPRGELVLTAPVCFGRKFVLPLVSDFLAAYPEISVRLMLSDRNLHLLDDHIDVAARIGALPDSSLMATRIGTMRTVVCAAPGFVASHGTPKLPEDLAALPAVNFDFLSPTALWAFHCPRIKDRREIPMTPRLSVSTAEAAVWAAAQGSGVTRVLHYQCADEVKAGGLRLLLEEFETEPLPVHLLHAGRSQLPSKTRVFLDFAAERLRQNLKGLREA